MSRPRRPLAARLLAAAAVAAVPFAAAAEPAEAGAPAPFLWKIDGPSPSWVFGTIHLPDERVLAWPASVQDALDRADAVYTEIPLDAKTTGAMAGVAMLPPGESLDALVPEDLLDRTGTYLATKGLPLQPFLRMKLWALSAQMSMLDYLPQLMTKKPLDMQLYADAEAAGKSVGGLESPEEQFAVFESLTLEEQIELHRQALDQLEGAAKEGRSPARELVDAYLSGDPQVLLDEMNAAVDAENPVSQKFMTSLIDDRNVLMADRIAAKVAAAPDTSFFFAVGAGHLPGDGGVVALLKKAGLELSRVSRARPAAVEAAPAAAGN